jgi:hypothetical protein
VTTAETVRVGPLSLPRRGVLVAAGLLVVELLALGWYLRDASVAVLEPRYLLYPFVWVNVGVLAVLGTRPVTGSSRRRGVAALLAAGYAGLLFVVDGSLALAARPPATGFHLMPLPPGWGPALAYDGATLTVTLFPYRVVGYAALAYLLYATLVEASRAALGGLLGLVSCVSCTLPVLAALVSGVAGGSVTAVATGFSYDLSTLVFVASVGLLYWRPLGR